MKALVVAASKHGSTLEIADAITKELATQGVEAELFDLSKGNPPGGIEGYDAVILGSAIYAGNWLPEARNFAGQYRAQLSALPLWLFSSGPLGADSPQPADDPSKLAAPLLLANVHNHRVFVGRLEEGNLGFAERLMARVVKAPYGDFRDWDDIRDWARSIAEALRPAVIPSGA